MAKSSVLIEGSSGGGKNRGEGKFLSEHLFITFVCLQMYTILEAKSNKKIEIPFSVLLRRETKN
jgi:hypothetical protein